MQDEKNNSNQPVILNLNPVNDTISQFMQLQSGILSDSEMFVPSDSILPAGTRVKVEYRLKSFGQKENVKIIDALAEVIGPEVDSEKGRRGVRVKFLKLSPTSQVLIQKLLEKLRSQKPQSGEKKAAEPKEIQESAKVTTVKIDEPKVQVTVPETEVSAPKIEVAEPKVQISAPSLDSTPSLSEIMAQHDTAPKKEEVQTQKVEEKKVVIEEKPSTLAEIMQKEMEKPKSGEIQRDDKQAQYAFEYLPPGQPLEENTGIVKIREIVRSSEVSNIKSASRIWIALAILLFVVVVVMGFFFAFPQYAPKIFVRSHEVSNVITKRDLTPENIPTPPPTRTAPVEQKQGVEEKKEVQPEAKVEEKKAEEKKEEPQKAAEVKVEENKEKEKVAEPEVVPLTEKKDKEKKDKQVKIITKSDIKKEGEKEKKVEAEKEKRAQEEKEEKVAAKAKEEAARSKAKKEAASQEPGKLVIQITPTDADLTVFIDGAQAGTMPTLSKQIPQGTHTIKVVADGYNEEVRKVEIMEGETKTIKINLKEK